MEIKPAAVVIPKETDHLEQGRHGPIYPRSPACHGFTIIAKVKEGRADIVRDYGYGLAKALETDPYLLAPLKLHYLRWVLFDNDTRFMYPVPQRPVRRRLQGIPRFVVTRGGEYCFMPGLKALRWLAELQT
jgi:hypothetical protein